MKRISLALTLLFTILVFSGCKKDLDDGGIKFSLIPVNTYDQITDMNLTISHQQYGPAISQIGSRHAEKIMGIEGLSPGKYHWQITIQYVDGGNFGLMSFDEDIIIEKGQIKHITIEY